MMTKNQRMEKARALHDTGVNCAQAVAMVFADVVGVSEKDLFRFAEGFGFGMGCAEGTCGAISGAVMIISLLSSSADPLIISKKETYAKEKAFFNSFLAKEKVSTCKYLKGLTAVPAVKPCPDIITDSVSLLCDQLSIT